MTVKEHKKRVEQNKHYYKPHNPQLHMFKPPVFLEMIFQAAVPSHLQVPSEPKPVPNSSIPPSNLDQYMGRRRANGSSKTASIIQTAHTAN